MQVTSTTGTGATTQNASADTLSLPTQMLSEQDFLNLLVTQMTSQDPLNPDTNQDLLTQMTQFSTLQNNADMQSGITGLQNSQLFSQANGLIGREVNLQVDSNTTTQGVVSGVDLSAGTPQIVVNGQSYDLSQVLGVTSASTTTPNTQ